MIIIFDFLVSTNDISQLHSFFHFSTCLELSLVQQRVESYFINSLNGIQHNGNLGVQLTES